MEHQAGRNCTVRTVRKSLLNHYVCFHVTVNEKDEAVSVYKNVRLHKIVVPQNTIRLFKGHGALWHQVWVGSFHRLMFSPRNLMKRKSLRQYIIIPPIFSCNLALKWSPWKHPLILSPNSSCPVLVLRVKWLAF